MISCASSIADVATLDGGADVLIVVEDIEMPYVSNLFAKSPRPSRKRVGSTTTATPQIQGSILGQNIFQIAKGPSPVLGNTGLYSMNTPHIRPHTMYHVNARCRSTQISK
eukprot:scpid50395/ scgid1480/ 